MAGWLKSIKKITGLALFLTSSAVNAQLFQDTATLKIVRKDVNYIYNLQFDSARDVYTKIIKLYPGHPIVYLLNGLMTYWENFPMLHTSPSHDSFEEDMRKCIKLSETNINPEYEAEYLLADLCARGMLLTFYDDNDLIMEVIPLTMSTYKHVRRAFDFVTVSADLNYFAGIYNYYREAFPKIYPVYKSLALLFPPGDIQTGLIELNSAAINSIVLKAESYALLTLIYLDYENKLPESLIFSKTLHEMYPENVFYLSTYIRNLLLSKKYDEAEKLMLSTPSEHGNKFFLAQLKILKGILQEKRYHDNQLAQQYYNDGINDISLFGKYGNEYAAYAYFGLSRISDENAKKHTRKIYRKEALKLADFKKINFDK